jgi:hypothetical protein
MGRPSPSRTLWCFSINISNLEHSASHNTLHFHFFLCCFSYQLFTATECETEPVHNVELSSTFHEANAGVLAEERLIIYTNDQAESFFFLRDLSRRLVLQSRNVGRRRTQLGGSDERSPSYMRGEWRMQRERLISSFMDHAYVAYRDMCRIDMAENGRRTDAAARATACVYIDNPGVN